MSTKLNQKLRAEIKYAAAIALLWPRLSLLNARRRALNLQAYKLAVPEEILEMAERHPGFFNHTIRPSINIAHSEKDDLLYGLSYIREKHTYKSTALDLTSMPVNISTFSRHSFGTMDFTNLTDPMPEFHGRHQNAPTVVLEDHPYLLAEYLKLYQREDAFVTDALAFSSLLEGILAVSTVELARATWPDIDKYLPAQQKAITKLPAINIKEVAGLFNRFDRAIKLLPKSQPAA